MGRLLAWVFHSPRRLLAVVVLPLIVATVLAGILSKDGTGKPEVSSTPSESVQPEYGSPPPAPPAFVSTPTPSAPPAQAVRAAEGFVQTWLAGRTTEPVAVWHRRIASFVTPQLAQGLRSTDPARLPATNVSGAPEPVQVGEFLARFSVPLADGSAVAVTTAWDGQAWRVTDIQPGGSP